MKMAVRVPIDPKVWEAAKVAADRKGISVDALANRAVREMLERRKRRETTKA